MARLARSLPAAFARPGLAVIATVEANFGTVETRVRRRPRRCAGGHPSRPVRW